VLITVSPYWYIRGATHTAVSGVGDPRERHAFPRLCALGTKGVLGSRAWTATAGHDLVSNAAEAESDLHMGGARILARQAPAFGQNLELQSVGIQRQGELVVDGGRAIPVRIEGAGIPEKKILQNLEKGRRFGAPWETIIRPCFYPLKSKIALSVIPGSDIHQRFISLLNAMVCDNRQGMKHSRYHQQ